MKDMSRVKQDERGYYMEYIHKNEKLTDQIVKIYGQIREHCLICNEPYFVTNSHIKEGYGQFCSKNCARTGKFNHSWKGGKIYSCGYVFILSPKHPFRDNHGYIQEHRLVMEKYLGRYLKPEERIHHKNRIKDDNRIENLELFENSKDHNRIHMSKENNPNWRGGLKDYYSAEFKKLREIIRKRDNYTCQLCGRKQNGRAHDVHHIDYDKENSDLNNLITLCVSCNAKTGFNREYWKKYFQELSKGR